MTHFDDRERGYENKFAKAQEIEFKITSRRNRLIAEWAASQMGLHAEKAHEYALAFVEAMLGEDADEAVIARLQADLSKAGVSVKDTDLERHFREAEANARKQLGS